MISRKVRTESLEDFAHTSICKDETDPPQIQHMDLIREILLRMEDGTVNSRGPLGNPLIDDDTLNYHVQLLEDASYVTRDTSKHGFYVDGAPVWHAWGIAWQGQ